MPSAALAAEGDGMLRALLGDLADMPGLSLRVLRDRRLPIPDLGDGLIDWRPVDPEDDPLERFAGESRQVDAVWPIAPETGGLLESLCRTVEALGKALLTSPARAVRLAASKRATVERLRQHGIPAVPTVAWDPQEPRAPFPWPVVIKPDDGVGGEETRILGNPAEWDAYRQQHANESRIVQPLLEGEDLSLSALFAGGEAVLLSINRQHIRQRAGGFALSGCAVNAIADKGGQYAALLQQAAAALPELWGYAGIDLLRRGSKLEVLEINPRLTSSYAGLKPALGVNPAQLVLNLWRTGRLPVISAAPLRPVAVTWELVA